MNRKKIKNTFFGRLIRPIVQKVRFLDEFLKTPKSIRDLRHGLSVAFPEKWNKPFHGLDSVTPLDMIKAKEILLTTCQVLEGNGVNYRVVFGTLLGLYRAGEIISHDTDLDLAVPDTSLGGILSAVQDLIDDNTFVLVRCNDHIISLVRDGIYIDLYLFQTKRFMYVIDRPVLECSDKFWLKREDFTCDRTIKYDNFSLRTIANPEEYFLNYYGRDWRTPIKGLHADLTNKKR